MDATHPSRVMQSFNEMKYPDLKVKCGDDTYQLHRAIVCSRVQYFEDACNDTSMATEIVLDDDDPYTINRMLLFIYTGDYPEGEIPHAQRPSNHEIAWTSPIQPDDDKLMNNVLVYAIADKYDLYELKKLARTRIQSLMDPNQPYTGASDFSDVVKTVFDLTSVADSELRDIFIRKCAENFPSVLEHPGLENVIQEIAPLSFGILVNHRKEIADCKEQITKVTEEKRLEITATQNANACKEEAVLQKDSAITKEKAANKARDVAIADKDAAIKAKHAAKALYDDAIRQKDTAVREMARLDAATRDNHPAKKIVAAIDKIWDLDECRNTSCRSEFTTWLECDDGDAGTDMRIQLRCSYCRCRHDIGYGTFV